LQAILEAVKMAMLLARKMVMPSGEGQVSFLVGVLATHVLAVQVTHEVEE
jgi:hypothetical protein